MRGIVTVCRKDLLGFVIRFLFFTQTLDNLLYDLGFVFCELSFITIRSASDLFL